MKINTLFFTFVVLLSLIGYTSCSSVQVGQRFQQDDSDVNSNALSIKQPFVQDDNNTCVDCFHLMVDILSMLFCFILSLLHSKKYLTLLLDDLVNELANGGVIGGCLDICSALNKSKILEGGCDALCLYVGMHSLTFTSIL